MLSGLSLSLKKPGFPANVWVYLWVESLGVSLQLTSSFL